MSQLSICVLGGTGFVGRVLTRQLAKQGHRLRLISRHPERHRDVTVLPTATVIAGDVYNPAFLRQQFDGSDAVINLIGILNERGRRGREFERVHSALPTSVAEQCKQVGVRRLLHMSALHASAQGPSHYLRTKALGEDAVHAAASSDFHVTSFRPSVIFGPQDSFINRFAGLLRLAPFVFPLACPNAKFQPVYVGDVVRSFIQSLDNAKTHGQRYDLCGPRVYTLRELVEYVAGLIGVKRRVIGLGKWMSKLQAVMLELAPGKPFSLDNYRSLQVDSICSKGFPEIFGFTPTTLEDIVPTYVNQLQRSQLHSERRRLPG